MDVILRMLIKIPIKAPKSSQSDQTRLKQRTGIIKLKLHKLSIWSFDQNAMDIAKKVIYPYKITHVKESNKVGLIQE